MQFSTRAVPGTVIIAQVDDKATQNGALAVLLDDGEMLTVCRASTSPSTT